MYTSRGVFCAKRSSISALFIQHSSSQSLPVRSGSVVFAAHRMRLSWLCTTYALDHRRCRRWVVKMQPQLLHMIQVTSTTGVWRSQGLHTFWGTEKFIHSREGCCTSTAHALTHLTISARCCAGEVPSYWEVKSLRIATAFLI